MITAKILEAANAVYIHSKHHLTAALTGKTQSLFKGSGMDFKEFRPYEPGDDIRHVSWPVTARTSRTTLKVFQTERDIDVVTIVDTSGSSFSGEGRQKIQAYAEIVAIVGLAAHSEGDRFGMMLFGDVVHQYLAPSRSPNTVRLALSQLLASEKQYGASRLSQAIQDCHHLLPHRSLVIIISDFLVDDFELSIRMASQRHEFILIHVQDPRESGLGTGFYEYLDSESGEILLLNANSAKFRDQLRREAKSQSQDLKTLSQTIHGGYLRISLGENIIDSLVHYFTQQLRCV